MTIGMTKTQKNYSQSSNLIGIHKEMCMACDADEMISYSHTPWPPLGKHDMGFSLLPSPPLILLSSLFLILPLFSQF